MGISRSPAEVPRRCEPEARALLGELGAHGGVMLIIGPAGIGKSTLAGRLHAHDADADARGLRRIAATRPDIEPPMGMWRRLATLAGVGSPIPPDHHGPQDPFEFALTVVRACAGPDIGAVICDDIHAADADSLTALAQVAPVVAGSGARLILTSRGADAVDDPLGRAAHHAIEAHARVLHLGPFDIAEVTERLMRHGIDAHLAQQFSSVYHRESAGTPLLLDQLLAATWPAGADPPDPAAVRAAAGGDGVVGVWRREVARLDPQDRIVLAVVAELGVHARRSLATEVLRGRLAEDITGPLARLAAHGLITSHITAHWPHEQIGLHHPAIADALADPAWALSPDLHLRIARCLADSGGEPRLVLTHMMRARDLVEHDERRMLALQVIAQAERLGDLRAAAEAWDVVIAPDTATTTDRLAAAEAWHRVGERARSRAVARRVAQDLDPHEPVALARAAILFADGAEFHGEANLAVALLYRARELLDGCISADPDDRAARRGWAEVTGALADLEMTMPVTGPAPQVHVEPTMAEVADIVRWHWVTRPEVAQPHAVAAEQAAAQVGDPVLMATTGLMWRRAHQGPAHAHERRARSEWARRVLVDHSRRAAALHAVALDALETGDLGDVQICLGELADVAAASGDPWVRWRHAGITAMLERLGARVEASEHHSAVAAAFGALAGEPTAVVMRVEQRTVLEAERLGDLRPVLALGARLDTVPHPPMLAGVLWLVSELGSLGLDVPPVSRPILEDLVAHLATARSHEQNWLCTVGFTAQVAAHLGSAALAEQVGALLEPWGGRMIRESSGVIGLGSVERLRGQLLGVCGAVDEALDSLERARAADRSAGFDWAVHAGDVARLQLLALHERIPESDLRGEALQVAAECTARGLHLLAARARRLGSHRGHAPLSQRQVKVLAGLALGLTYQQIADAIGYSHGTVRGEVSAAYAALGVDSREEAVAEAEWRGLLPASAFAGWPSEN